MLKGVWIATSGIALVGSALMMNGCAMECCEGMDSSCRTMMENGAICAISPTAGNRCSGVVHFTQVDDGVLVEAEIKGLDPGSKHGFHIHEFGYCGSDDATCTGGHYDPEGTGHHAMPGESEAHHAGDMGNLVADGQGIARYHAVIKGISICGKNGIIGHAIIVHAKADDGGQPTGNAGARIGVGTIGVATESAH